MIDWIQTVYRKNTTGNIMPFAPKEPNKKIWRMAKFCTTPMPICCRGWNRSHSQHKRKQKSCHWFFRVVTREHKCHTGQPDPPNQTSRCVWFIRELDIQIKRLGWTQISWQTSKYPTKQTTISISNSFRRYQHHPDKQIPRDLAINSDAEQR